MKEQTIVYLSRMISSGQISARELTQEYLNRINAKNSQINAYISFDGDIALKTAESIDKRISLGEPVGELCGIPFAAKDNLCTQAFPTTCGGKMLEGFVSPYTATSVERLLSHGAVLLGKTNMDEFGMGSATNTSAFGLTYNPLDRTRTVGGSSGGSAAAVAAGLCAFALGSDTGGSIRLPAAFCGCVGLKPTYGAVSRYGLVSFASSLDTVGVLAPTVDDCERVFSGMCGRDAHDPTSVEYSPLSTPLDRPLRIGICKSTTDSASDGVARCVYAAASALKALGCEIADITLPDKDTAVAAYYIISCAEASSNLGRFDGIRYGHRAKGANTLQELLTRSRSEGFGDEVKRRIMLGTYCLHGDERMDYYAAARQAASCISSSLTQILNTCDVIILPTSHTVAPHLDDGRSHLSVWRDDAFCLFASLSGLPALTLPFGKHDGMPVGIQLIGRAFDEDTVFKVGKMLEVLENE